MAALLLFGVRRWTPYEGRGAIGMAHRRRYPTIPVCRYAILIIFIITDTGQRHGADRCLRVAWSACDQNEQ
eukprot:17695-Eustigmatos_ZCMA.PRE.1